MEDQDLLAIFQTGKWRENWASFGRLYSDFISKKTALTTLCKEVLLKSRCYHMSCRFALVVILRVGMA